jgi:prevent-host-death family protein
MRKQLIEKSVHSDEFVVYSLEMNVGIAEFRQNLREFLEKVQQGDEISITDRGKVVARVTPVKKVRKLDEMIAQGLVRPPRSTGKFIPKPIKLKDGATVSEFIAEQRR